MKVESWTQSRWTQGRIDHSPYIVDFRSLGRVVTIRFQIPTSASRQTFWVARVFFPYGAL